MNAPAADPRLLVACLCAGWCGTCREYFPGFAAQAASRDTGARFLWVDIEDHDEVPGDLDIDNFPTLLFVRDDEVLFFGTVTPHLSTLERLVDRALAGDLTPLRQASLDGLPARLRAVAAQTVVRPGDPVPGADA